MSEEIGVIESPNLGRRITVTRFFGGSALGRCYQITCGGKGRSLDAIHNWVQLTREEMRELTVLMKRELDSQ